MATANPNFQFQQQALTSLNQIHLVCLVLEVLQVCASLIALSMGYVSVLRELSGAAHLYAALLYLFSAVFAHVVVFYVLFAVAKSVGLVAKNAFKANPQNLDPEIWRDLILARPSKTVLPYFVAHAALLLTSVFVHAPLPQQILAWSSSIFGVFVVVRVFKALQQNKKRVTSVVTSPWLNR